MSQNQIRSKSSRQAWIWVIAAVVAVIVLAGLVFYVRFSGTDSASAPPPSITVTSSSTPSPGTSSSAPPSAPATTAAAAGVWPDAGCNGSSAPPIAPQSAMTDVQWKPFLAAAIPVSPTLGPTKTDGPLRTCFQHSPAGALLAAVNIELATATPGQGAKVVNAQFTPGPGRDKALSDVAKSTGSVANVAAFRLVGCTPEACNVEVIFFGGGRYVDGLLPVVWTDGDWRRDGSHTVGEPGLVASIPPGFTAWSPSA